jgi:putative MATE family efflux protein
MIAMFANALYNIVDTIFVGKGVGSLGIAAVAIVLPIMAIVSSFAHLIGIGTSTLISRQLGRGKTEEVNKIAGNGFLMIILVGFFFSFIGLMFTDPILRGFGATETILPYAHRFGKIIFIGMLWFPFCVSTSNYLRAEGNARDAMNAMLIGILLNVILDYILIFPLQMGIRGAAIATIAGKFATLIYLIIYFLQRKSIISFSFKKLRIQKHILKPTVSVGLSGFGMRSSSSVANVVLNHTLGSLGGDMAIAIFGIIYKITLFLGMPLFGLNQGMLPIVGYNYGADKRERIVKTIKLGYSYSLIYGIIAVVLFMVFSKEVFALFTNEATLLEHGPRALRIIISMMWLMGIATCTMGVHQAMGKARSAFILAIQRWVLLIVPLILVLPKIGNLGLDGVWYAFPIADFTAALIASLLVYKTLKKEYIIS